MGGQGSPGAPAAFTPHPVQEVKTLQAERVSSPRKSSSLSAATLGVPRHSWLAGFPGGHDA